MTDKAKFIEEILELLIAYEDSKDRDIQIAILEGIKYAASQQKLQVIIGDPFTEGDARVLVVDPFDPFDSFQDSIAELGRTCHMPIIEPRVFIDFKAQIDSWHCGDGECYHPVHGEFCEFLWINPLVYHNYLVKLVKKLYLSFKVFYRRCDMQLKTFNNLRFV